MATKVASLYVDLLANTKQFISELDKSRTASTAFGVAVGKIAADIAESFARIGVEAAQSLPRLIKSSIDVADAMSKAAQKAQISVEAFSALNHAAELADVSTESLTASLGRFSRNVAESLSGNKKIADAFQQVGVGANELKSLGIDEVFARVAEGFSKIPDGAKKAQVGFELFGKSWQDLVPLLNQGRTGIEQAMESARQLGLIVGSDTGKAAEQFNDNLKELQGAVSGLGLSIAHDILPQLNSLVQSTVEWVKSSGAVPRIAQLIVDAFRGLVIEAAAAVVAYDGMRVTLLSLEEAWLKFKSAVVAGIPGGALLIPDLQKQIDATREALKQAQVDLGKDLQGLDKVLAVGARPSAAPAAPKIQAPEFIDPGATKKLNDLIAAFNDALRPADQLNEKLLQLAESGKAFSDVLKVYGEQSIKAAEAQKAHDEALPPYIAHLSAIAKAQADARTQLDEYLASGARQAIQATDLTDTYIEQRAKLDSLREALQKTKDELDFSNALGKPIDMGFLDKGIEQSKQLAIEQSRAALAAGDVKKAIELLNFDPLTIQIPHVKSALKDLADTGKQVGQAISSGIEDAIQHWQGFRNLALSVLNDIAATILRNQVIAPLTGWLSGFLGTIGSALGGIFGGGASASNAPVHLAGGGPADAGRLALVGEQGPELFVPSVSGMIIPHEKTMEILETIRRWSAAVPRAAGGMVSAGSSYLVGERGREAFMPSFAGAGASGVAVHVSMPIDARGAEIGVEEKIARTLSRIAPAIIEQAVAAGLDRQARR